MQKNLKEVNYPEKFLITTLLDSLKKNAEDPYNLSIVLLASGLQADKKTYQEILLKIIKSLNQISDYSQNSFKSWMLGRIVFAANCMDDHETVINTIVQLKKLLEDSKTAKDAFSTWAFGYLAGMVHEYAYAKERMLAMAMELNKIHQETKKKSDDPAKIQETLSNALWAWVMNAQAAANNQDHLIYHQILNQIKNLTGQEQISKGLKTGLLRTSASNDYPAWAMSMILTSASMMQDIPLRDELEKPLTESINSAKNLDAKAEVILATLFKELVKFSLVQANSITNDKLLTNNNFG